MHPSSHNPAVAAVNQMKTNETKEIKRECRRCPIAKKTLLTVR